MKEEKRTLEEWLKDLFNEYKKQAAGDENMPVTFKRIDSLENHPTKIKAHEMVLLMQYTNVEMPHGLR